VEFRILGEVEVLGDNGEKLEVVGHRQRALVALLATHPNEAVSADRLVEALWEDETPANAANALQTVVSRLRRALGETRVVTRAPGYALRAEPDELDASRFEALAAEARAALEAGDAHAAVESFRSSLSLWRGPALSEFVYARFAQAEIARLEERRLAVLEQRIEAELALGRHADLVAELDALASAHPLRERLQAQRLLALYRAGRQADALARYRELRTLLRDSHGLEPGTALRELERAILLHDPALDPPAVRSHEPARASQEAGPPPGPARTTDRRLVSVAYVELDEIAGIDGALDPERLRGIQRRVFDELAALFTRHGGRPEVLPGDAALAAFGLEQAHEDDAARAIRAACGVAEALTRATAPFADRLAAPLTATVGVATSELVSSEDGVRGARVVRVAARLAREAAPGEPLVDALTVSLAPHVATYEQDGAEGAPGEQRFRVTGAPASHPLARPVGPAAFVNRETERALLAAALERARRERRPQVVTLLGPPGIGKSRLVREFTTSVPADTTIAVGRCLSYGESTSVFALDAVVRDLVGHDVAAGLAARLADVERGEQIADRVAIAIGAGGRGGPGEEIQWAFRRLLERVAGDGPLVVALDDLHWAEPWLLDLVEYLAAFADGPIVLLALARPELLEERPSWAGPEGPGVLEMLEPLSTEHTEQLVAGLLVDASPPPGAARRFVQQSEGNPLFAEQVVAFAIEQSFASVTALPSTLRALLQERIDRLSDEERDVLARAAIEGTVFHRRTLTALAQGDTAGHDGATVLALMRKGFVGPARAELAGDDAFRFRHILLHSAAYEAVPKERRARLHLQFADWLEQHDVGADAMLGHHLGQAWRYAGELGDDAVTRTELGRRAAAHLVPAAEAAIARSAVPAAVALFGQAAAMLPEGSAEHADALVELGAALLTAGRLDDSEAALGAAESAARAGGHARAGAHAGVLRLQVELQVDPGPALSRIPGLTSRAAGTFARGSDELGMCRVEHTRALGHWFAGRCQSAGEAWERAASHARRGSLEWALPDMLAWVASSLQLGPEPVPQAIVRCEDLRGETQSHPLWQAFVMRPLGLLYAMNGELERSRAVFEECDRLLDEMGETIHSAAPDREAEAALLEGDPERAERLLRRGSDRLEAMGDRAQLSLIATLLARAVEEQGRTDEAFELSLVGERFAIHEDVCAQVIWRAVRARALASRGSTSEAERLAREAVELAAGTDWLIGRGDAAWTLGVALFASGAEGEAYQAWSDALSFYEHKGAVLSVASMKAAIAARTSSGAASGTARHTT
jgi:DNA-binding SARP family transcriptional activator